MEICLIWGLWGIWISVKFRSHRRRIRSESAFWPVVTRGPWRSGPRPSARTAPTIARNAQAPPLPAPCCARSGRGGSRTSKRRARPALTARTVATATGRSAGASGNASVREDETGGACTKNEQSGMAVCGVLRRRPVRRLHVVGRPVEEKEVDRESSRSGPGHQDRLGAFPPRRKNAARVRRGGLQSATRGIPRYEVFEVQPLAPKRDRAVQQAVGS